jgi:hypothetical protein
MISLEMQKFLELSDGVVLQYKLNNSGNWENIGNKETGINWYNSSNIVAQPGGQKEGWTSAENIPDADWLNVAHGMDELANKQSVRLRFAFALRSGSDANGIILDNIKIKERAKVLLVEHFTNASDQKALEANQTVDELTTANHLNRFDYLQINYHKNSPVDDPFYSFYPTGTNTKMLRYNISSIPYSMIDGGVETGFKLNYSDLLWNTQLYNNLNKKVLEDPGFHIRLKSTTTNTTISLKAVVEAMRDFEFDMYNLNIAVVEKNVELNSQVYKNVLRGLIPNAGGSSMEREWKQGDSVVFNFNWNGKAAIDLSKVRLIAFIQNANTKQVYQANTNDPEFITGTSVDLERNYFTHMLVYPNPARNYINIEFANELQHATNIKIFNQSGQIVQQLQLSAGTQSSPIEVSNLKAGYYFIKAEGKSVSSKIEKLIILK